MNLENSLISYDKMKIQIEQSLNSFFEKNNILDRISLPAISFEKGATSVSFPTPTSSESLLFNFLDLIKRFIKNVRIHSFESGYYAFQALNGNLFKTENVLDNIKIEFFVLTLSSRVEITKKGNLTQEEINLVIELFKIANKDSSNNPASRLIKLGASLIKDNEDISWDYMAGYEVVKKKIRESIIMPLQNPNIYDSVAKMTRKVFESNRPNAILFEGGPGVGKTTAARIIAGEVNIPLVYVPVESIMSKWYGQSSQNLSDIFDACDDMGGAIIFLDEIDSLVGSRDQNMFEATRRILSVLLRKLDGIDSTAKTLTIGATNRKMDLDHALLSRFDQTINFPLPNSVERGAIFHNYAHHLDAESIAILGERAKNLSGRTIKDVCELAERRWVRKLLIQKTEPTPPPIEYYKQALKNWFSEQ